MKRLNLAGSKFGRLEVLHATFEKRGRRSSVIWNCVCECGSTNVLVATAELRRGQTKSCGCLRRETAKLQETIHGKAKTQMYGLWNAMKQRCCNPNSDRFKYYGARGITVCDEWKNDFQQFLADVGVKPAGKSLDRIDNNGPYAPWNVRWADQRQQQANQRPVSTERRSAARKAAWDKKKQGGVVDYTAG